MVSASARGCSKISRNMACSKTAVVISCYPFLVPVRGQSPAASLACGQTCLWVSIPPLPQDTDRIVERSYVSQRLHLIRIACMTLLLSPLAVAQTPMTPAPPAMPLMPLPAHIGPGIGEF